MRKLIEGVLRFKREVRSDYLPTFEKLANTQEPGTMVLTCSDSRVVPTLFLSEGPGEVFIHRNVGNLMPRALGSVGLGQGDISEGAALEYAINALGVADVVVMGHSNCGAMRGVMQGARFPGNPNLEAWLVHAEESLRRMKSTEPTAGLGPQDWLSQINAVVQREHVQSYPCVKEALAAGKVRTHAWWFDVGPADVWVYVDKTGRFELLTPAFASDMLDALGEPPLE